MLSMELDLATCRKKLFLSKKLCSYISIAVLVVMDNDSVHISH